MIPYFNSLLDILFPPAFFSCHTALNHKTIGLLCGPCRDSIPRNTAFTCPQCRGRVPSYAMRCHKDAGYLLLAASSYENPAVRALIWQLKFRHRTAAASELARLMSEIMSAVRLPAREYILVPIPLYVGRLRERGFNQAELIACELSMRTGAEVNSKVLLKIHKTKPQSETKNRDERRKNLRNCFAVTSPESIAGKNIILVDDVWTSGTTMNEAVSALKLAGAGRVIALVAAKAG